MHAKLHRHALLASAGKSALRLLRRIGWAPASRFQRHYQRWIEAYDTHGEHELIQLRDTVLALPRTPRISVIVPVYNTSAQYLVGMIESVRAQVYPHWELCLADDASNAPHVAVILQDYAQQDPRVRVVLRPSNGHISAASNSALALATGEYVALLDHDDLLPPHALVMAVKYLNAHPGARLFYSDEDKVSFDGKRHSPYFKPDWDSELIVQQNFFCHLGIYDLQLVRSVGGFRVGFEGSQDHDLILRCLREVGETAIVHIPHVLYHWRSIEGSTAAGIEQKPYATSAAWSAVVDHLNDDGVDAEVRPPTTAFPFVKISYPLPPRFPSVRLVIESFGDTAALKRCIREFLSGTDYPALGITLVTAKGHRAGDEFDKALRDLRPDVAWSRTSSLDQAIVECDEEYVCLLNEGMGAGSADWLTHLMRYAIRPGIGLSGAKLCRPSGRLVASGLVRTSREHAVPGHVGAGRSDPGYFGLNLLTRSVSALPAMGVVAKRSTFLSVRKHAWYTKHGWERGVVLSNVIEEMGLRCVLASGVILICGRGASGLELKKSPAAYLDAKFKDGSYNPNLSLRATGASFGLSFPPRIDRFQ